MAISRSKKEEILANLEANIKDAKSIGFVNTNALAADEITTIRKDLRDVNAKMIIAKKTLIKLAMKNVLNVEIADEQLPNQIAVVISFEDAIAGLGKMNEHKKNLNTKEITKITFTGAYMDERVLGQEEATKLAGLPSRDTLLAKFMGSLMSPVSGLARFFDGAKAKLEETGGTTVADLIAEIKEESAPAKEEPKAEEKAETPTEAPATEEKKEEAPAETEEKPAE